MLSVRDLRNRIREGLTEILGPQHWTESRYPPELFGQDTREQRHLGFSVGVPSTVPGALDRQSTHGGAGLRGAVAETTVAVRWGYRLRAVGTTDDYDGALEAELALTGALFLIDRSPELGFRITQLQRSVLPGDEMLLLGTVTLIALHRTPL